MCVCNGATDVAKDRGSANRLGPCVMSGGRLQGQGQNGVDACRRGGGQASDTMHRMTCSRTLMCTYTYMYISQGTVRLQVRQPRKLVSTNASEVSTNSATGCDSSHHSRRSARPLPAQTWNLEPGTWNRILTSLLPLPQLDESQQRGELCISLKYIHLHIILPEFPL